MKTKKTSSKSIEPDKKSEEEEETKPKEGEEFETKLEEEEHKIETESKDHWVFPFRLHDNMYKFLKYLWNLEWLNLCFFIGNTFVRTCIPIPKPFMKSFEFTLKITGKIWIGTCFEAVQVIVTNRDYI